MSSGIETSSFGKFTTFVGRRFPRRQNMPWSHSSKVALWIGLASASWAVVIAIGYFIWSSL
jgi:hypothetical protein